MLKQLLNSCWCWKVTLGSYTENSWCSTEPEDWCCIRRKLFQHCGVVERNWTGVSWTSYYMLWQRVWQRDRDWAWWVLQEWKCLNCECIGCIYTLHTCTSELVLKGRMQSSATCIIYKEHSWEEMKSSHSSMKLETKVVIKLIYNHKAM